MKVVGLITEYNPFHKGHLYHIKEAKRITGADFVVVVMSGNFLQRGSVALIDKYSRTKMALMNGGDLIIELPVCFSTGSAEYFAMGAISILNMLNVVDYICFGSECGDIKLLTNIAKVLADEPDIFSEGVRLYIKEGLTYPSARVKALLDYFQESREYIVDGNLDYLNNVLSSPNNILGIEYIKALIKSNSSIKPLTVTRITSGYHDESLNKDVCSATAIRMSLLKGKDLTSIKNNVPESVYGILNNCYHKSFPIFDDDFSLLLKYKILTEDNLSFDKYVDVSSGLDMRISKEINGFTSFTEYGKLIKSKQFTMTRINRGFIHIILNIYVNDFEYFVKNGYSQYIRILGFRRESSNLLKLIKKNTDSPIITKVADANKILSKLSMLMLNQDIMAADIYNSVVYDKYNYMIKSDFVHGIIIQ